MLGHEILGVTIYIAQNELRIEALYTDHGHFTSSFAPEYALNIDDAVYLRGETRVPVSNRYGLESFWACQCDTLKIMVNAAPL
jgi:hypothetical protein